MPIRWGEAQPEAGPGDVVAFLRDSLVAKKGSVVTFNALYVRYERWCAKRGRIALEPKPFVLKLHEMLSEAGITVEMRGENATLIDVQLKHAAL